MIEIDNKKMWESILRFSFEAKTEDVRKNPVGTAIKFIGDSIKHALNEQGLEYKDGVIVSIEHEQDCHLTGIGSKNATGKLNEMTPEEMYKIKEK